MSSIKQAPCDQAVAVDDHLQKKIQDDFLKCAVCYDTFTNPKNLDCGHIVCLGCIEGIIEAKKKRSSFHCPICREETNFFWRNGPCDLPDNLMVLGMISMLQNNSTAVDTSVDKNIAEHQQSSNKQEAESLVPILERGKEDSILVITDSSDTSSEDDSDGSCSESDSSDEELLQKNYRRRRRRMSIKKETKPNPKKTVGGKNQPKGVLKDITTTSRINTKDSLKNAGQNLGGKKNESKAASKNQALSSKPGEPLKSCNGMRVGSKILVFAGKPRPLAGKIHWLEKVIRKPGAEPQIFAGIQLKTKESFRVGISKEFRAIKNYKGENKSWLKDEKKFLRAVVPIHQCLKQSKNLLQAIPTMKQFE